MTSFEFCFHISDGFIQCDVYKVLHLVAVGLVFSDLQIWSLSPSPSVCVIGICILVFDLLCVLFLSFLLSPFRKLNLFLHEVLRIALPGSKLECSCYGCTTYDDAKKETVAAHGTIPPQGVIDSEVGRILPSLRGESGLGGHPMVPVCYQERNFRWRNEELGVSALRIVRLPRKRWSSKLWSESLSYGKMLRDESRK